MIACRRFAAALVVVSRFLGLTPKAIGWRRFATEDLSQVLHCPISDNSTITDFKHSASLHRATSSCSNFLHPSLGDHS